MDIRFIKLSNYTNQRTEFSRLIYDSYKLIDFIGEDYEHLCNWYWGKAVPWVFKGDMEFFIALNNSDTVIGLLIAKKENTERKICTLCIDPSYSNMGIASNLLKLSFEFLQTNKPIITFSENKFDQFKFILKKFNWSIDEKKFKPYNRKYEFICNTKIAK